MPPKNVTAIDSVFEAGLDEISFNIEIFDEKTALKMIPCKCKVLSKSQYIKSLDYAVDLFGEKNVSSCLVVGLEDVHSAVNGVEFLMSRGVVPKLSVFRPTIGSLLQDCSPPSSSFLREVYIKSEEKTKEYDVPLGPLCIPCQMHSLTIPKDQKDYFYF
jgi:biotin synthase-related radical SAM superfamily protein